MIVTASIDERGKAYGGQAGDQTGREVFARTWYKYSGGWTEVYKPPSEVLGRGIAQLAYKWATGNLVGYDQYQRNTLLRWVVDNNSIELDVAVECDCSSFCWALCWATGAINTSQMAASTKKGYNSPTTSTIGSYLMQSGWTRLKGSKYLVGDSYLGMGWFINKQGRHIVTNISWGSNYLNYPEPKLSLQRGSKGKTVMWLQWHLQMLVDHSLAVDGDFGKLTEKAVYSFQQMYPTCGVDGIVGLKTRSMIKKMIQAL